MRSSPFHCDVATRHSIFFFWRPFLRDPKDDMVPELAVKADCGWIVTFNVRDFARGREVRRALRFRVFLRLPVGWCVF
jgi:hypothetical protein